MKISVLDIQVGDYIKTTDQKGSVVSVKNHDPNVVIISILKNDGKNQVEIHSKFNTIEIDARLPSLIF